MSFFESRKIVYNNLAATTLAGGVTASQTTVTVTDGAVFPTPAGGEIVTLVLRDDTLGWYEIMNVTARSGNTLTVERGAEETIPQAWPNGHRIVNAITAALWNRLYLGRIPPLVFTSQPYAIEDFAASGTELAGLDGYNWRSPIEGEDATLGMLDGTLVVILRTYSDAKPEGEDVAQLLPQDGTLVVILRTYSDAKPEGEDVAQLLPQNGDLYSNLINYTNGKPEGEDIAQLLPQNGTLA